MTKLSAEKLEQIEREKDCVGSKPLILVMDSQARVHRFENDELTMVGDGVSIKIYEGTGVNRPYSEFMQWQWVKTYNLQAP